MTKKLPILLCTLLSFSVLSKEVQKRRPANFFAIQPPVEQGEMWTQEEVKNVETIADIFRETLIDSTGNAKVMRRDAHPKAHGCVSADLKIDNTKLSEEFRVGLFKENLNHKAIIRFSNGDPDFKKHDADKDVRGMALKLVNVPYQNFLQEAGVESGTSNHDFVFMNATEFFIPNPKSYEKFMKSTQGRFGVLSYLLFHWKTLGSIFKARVAVGNPLDLDYGSAVPYKLGKSTMKMKFKTCKVDKDAVPEDGANDFLGQNLESHLSQTSSCFDFYVQKNNDPKKNDIEDAMLKWEEKKSPYVKVGKLTINKQKGFRSKLKMKACEAMTFNPWRSHPENRPMGGVNRVRLEVYLNQFKLRSEHNKN